MKDSVARSYTIYRLEVSRLFILNRLHGACILFVQPKIPQTSLKLDLHLHSYEASLSGWVVVQLLPKAYTTAIQQFRYIKGLQLDVMLRFRRETLHMLLVHFR
jgi:hypothetical protein